MNAVLARLKNETRALHARIEASVSVLDPALDELGYRRYLEQLFGFHAPVEDGLRALPALTELGLELEARWKSERLERDLAALGLSRAQIARLPRCPATPRIADVHDALGCMYVLEGATLGGQLVFRELSRRIPGTMEVASRYLRCYAEQTGARWRAFGAVLEPHGSDERAQRAMSAAARATFASLQRWLEAGAPDAAKSPRVAHG